MLLRLQSINLSYPETDTPKLNRMHIKEEIIRKFIERGYYTMIELQVPFTEMLTKQFERRLPRYFSHGL